MAYDLNALSPEEKDQLLTQLIAKYDAGDAPAGDDHPDAPQDAAMREPFAKVLEILIDKVEALEDRVAKTESLVIDDLFGGIQKMYSDNLRTKGVDDVRGKYGDLFAPHMDALKELAPDEDLFDALYEMIEGAKNGGDWDDEKELGAVKGAADSIAAKIAKIKGTGAPAEEAKPAEAVEVTKVTAGAAPDAAEAFMSKLKDMKKKAIAKGAY